ncbi:hypothetical protein PLICRDRAFT_701208 [Plicaturopsis crispa FD-325 SS-3]|uniref:Uncharacterized protein n=1 Tax=Plicaturopsis crispa FD-325 SS-3 TaxID=944288 RepID=A0A0C9T6N7_PLICR|nr:hypothetical protein PLICRDRAFT_701208 [Plicaturopsis crispa FD-325 SS-3]
MERDMDDASGIVVAPFLVATFPAGGPVAAVALAAAGCTASPFLNEKIRDSIISVLSYGERKRRRGEPPRRKPAEFEIEIDASSSLFVLLVVVVLHVPTAVLRNHRSPPPATSQGGSFVFFLLNASSSTPHPRTLRRRRFPRRQRHARLALTENHDAQAHAIARIGGASAGLEHCPVPSRQVGHVRRRASPRQPRSSRPPLPSSSRTSPGGTHYFAVCGRTTSDVRGGYGCTAGGGAPALTTSVTRARPPRVVPSTTTATAHDPCEHAPAVHTPAAPIASAHPAHHDPVGRHTDHASTPHGRRRVPTPRMVHARVHQRAAANPRSRRMHFPRPCECMPRARSSTGARRMALKWAPRPCTS